MTLKTVYKQSPKGVWTPREASWVIFHKDSPVSVIRLIRDGGIVATDTAGKRKLKRPRYIITTAAINNALRKRYGNEVKPVNEQDWFNGMSIQEPRRNTMRKPKEDTPKLGEII